VRCMCFTKRAILLQLQFVRHSFFILRGGIIALLTILASQRYVISHI